MATISVYLPDEHMATVIAAVREGCADMTDGLTDDEAARYAIKAHLRDVTRRYRLRHADSTAVADADAAVAASETARGVAVQARKDAEAAALAEVDSMFEEIG